MLNKLRNNVEKKLLYAGRLCLGILDGMFLFVSRKPSIQKDAKVLIVRLDAIGDFILWLDAAKELRKLYPQDKYHITLIGNSLWTELAKELPYFDDVWPLNKWKFASNPLYRLKFLHKVRNFGFRIVLQSTFSRQFIYGDAIVRASGAAVRIGWQGDNSNIAIWQKRISDNWYTMLIPASNKDSMELERNAEFLRELGLKQFRSSLPTLSIRGPKPKSFTLKQYYILVPAASVGIKRWPLSNFAELMRRIYDATGWTGVVCGGAGEESIGKLLQKDSSASLQNWTGQTTLRELTAIITDAKMLIGNDTSAVHIAAAVSTPAICILGGGHFRRFIPYKLESTADRPLPVAVYSKMPCFNCNWECIYTMNYCESAPCIKNITVDQVWNTVENVLANINKYK